MGKRLAPAHHRKPYLTVTTMQDPTDYADTISYLSDFAEGLELEITHGSPADPARLHKASLLLHRAIALLQPLAEVGPDDDTAIEAPLPADLCHRCHNYSIFDRAAGLCSQCCVEIEVDALLTPGYTADEAHIFNGLEIELWGHR